MQYTHLHFVDGSPLPDVPEYICEELGAIAEQVKAATGCSGWYHEGMRGIQWHVGDEPNGGPYADILFQGDRYIPIAVDETIERILMSVGRSRQEKDAEMKSRSDASKSKVEYERMSRAYDLAPELRDRLKYNERVADNKHSRRVFHIPTGVPNG